MPARKPPVQRNWKPLLDPDRIGLMSGMLLATLVMGIGFWRNVNEFLVLFRAAIAFAGAWAAAFVVVSLIKHIARQELEAQQKALDNEETAESEEAPGGPVPGEHE
jgi:hypothetical protein